MVIYYLNQVFSQVSDQKAGFVLHKTINPVPNAIGAGFITDIYVLFIGRFDDHAGL
jgi:hypothetical protein